MIMKVKDEMGAPAVWRVEVVIVNIFAVVWLQQATQ